ncbi:MAG: L-serine ammonia-lyase, iron-sulfur-dependent, subunit alpha [Bacteroidetes bacterium]|nr:L-serine ammonia-lyase, iron-sulfur-dependent, subunit alpha [Bacteroidota bacterium]
MKSLKELYRIGTGPSSSHTMAPRRAAVRFAAKYPNCKSFQITLYSSLAATGKGHLTDDEIRKAFAPKELEIIWKPDDELPIHPNGMEFSAIDENGNIIGKHQTFSTGGGSLSDDEASEDIYNLKTIDEILNYCLKSGKDYWEYVEECEGKEIWDYLKEVWNVMKGSIERGLNNKGALPGELGLPRKARTYFQKSKNLSSAVLNDALLTAYAYAVSEENASGGEIVTAPTCGACGSVPAVLYHLLKSNNDVSEIDILYALATAGLFGNIVKHNGSISGAMVGCQGEVGTGCAMAAAAACQLNGGSPRQIEYAAEMGLEHHLGLTCDPVLGLVQIPCIERNAHAANRAIDCSTFALLSDGVHKISFDDVVEVLLETGKSLHSSYRETSKGGLAQLYHKKFVGLNPDLKN